MTHRRTGVIASLLLISSLVTSQATASASTAIPKLQLQPQQFKGLGDIALLIGNDGISGSNLFTLLNFHQSTRSYFVQSHVIAASFSGDGLWMSTSVIQNNQIQNFLVSSNGKAKTNLGSALYAGTFVPHGHTYYYSTMRGKFYQVTPPANPVEIPIQLPPNSRITGISFFNQQQALLSLTLNDNHYTEDYDQIAIWNVGSTSLSPLIKSTPPNGLILGPWLNQTAFFYWYDPYHSASIAADGLPLYVYQNGKSTLVSHTYASANSVLPVNGQSAIIWQNYSRSYFLGDQESLIFWPHRSMKVPTPKLAMFPALNPSHTQMAVVLGKKQPVNQLASGTAINRWFSSLQLGTISLPSHSLNVLKNAGTGVMSPAFDASGKRIVYALTNQAAWINANGQGTKHVFASVIPSSAQNELQIVSYLP